MSDRRDNGSGTIYFNSSAGKWFASYPIGKYQNGRPKYKTFTGNSESEVRKKLRVFSKNQESISVSAQAKWTLERYMRYWLETFKKVEVKISTYSRYVSTAQRNIYPEIGHIQMMSLTADHIQQLINQKLKQGYSYSSIKKIHDLLNPCLTDAVSKNVIARNPMIFVKMPKEKQVIKRKCSDESSSEAERYFRQDEKDRLVSICKSEYSNGKQRFSYGYAYILMLHTGLRPGEMLALCKGDVDLNNKTISVSKTLVEYEIIDGDGNTSRKVEIQNSPKSDSSNRTISLNSNALDAINHLLKDNVGETVLAAKTGAFVTPANFRKRWRSVCKVANVEYRSPHTLRHTFATNLFYAGADVKTVSALLGHANTKITYDIYIHVIEDRKTDAVKLIEDL